MEVKQAWEIPHCNNCGANEAEIFLKDLTSWEYTGTFTLVKCKICSLVYLKPRPTPDQVGKYYSKKSYWGDDLTYKTAKKHWKQEREGAYRYLYSEILAKKPHGAILDIGAGTGMFLTRFKEFRWGVEGVELSGDAVLYAQKVYGIKLKQGDFLDIPFSKNYFDVITLNNVLEHLHDPIKTLRKAYQVLKVDGLIIITVPNINSLGAWIFGRHWYALQPPRHLYQFSPETLRNMLERSGLVVEKIKHDYWTHNYYSLFESFRIHMSPRFKKRHRGGLVVKNYKKKFSVIVEGGKIFGKSFARTLAFLEPILDRGEVLTMYATKKG